MGVADLKRVVPEIKGPNSHTERDKYEPWEYGKNWQSEFARALLLHLHAIEKGTQQLPAGSTFDRTLFVNLLDLLSEALHVTADHEPLRVEEVNAFLKMPAVQKMFHDFSYNTNPAVLKAINGLGSSICKAWLANGRHVKFSELVNKKGFEEAGLLTWWVNPNSGFHDPRNTVTDHSVILWDEYKAPESSKVKLTIKSIRGIDLEKKDKSGTSDPYVVIGQRVNEKWHELHKTDKIKENLNPKWPGLNATIEVDTSQPLIFVVNDWDLVGHDFMGSWIIDVKVLQFLKQKYNKNTFTIIQKFSGLRRDQKEVEWGLVTTGTLEFIIEL